jgi:hypothetical protein
VSPGASPIDVDALVAIDVHVHAERSARTGADGLTPELRAASVAYFGSEAVRPTAEEVADYYRSRSMAAVIFAVDSESVTGMPPVPNEEVAEVAAANPDVLIPFASIDPAKGRRGVLEARRLIETCGVRGFKFHPNLQAFFPNDRSVYPLYEEIAAAGLPALFHTGHSGIGSGLPGGGGIRLKYSNPMCVDDVAADFPTLTIVLAHPSFPWQDEAISVALHKQQVYIDLSGWSPKYFPPQLVRYANTLLRDRVLFGSDYPLITPDRWLDDFAQLEIKPEVRPLILKQNAARLLGLGAPA